MMKYCLEVRSKCLSRFIPYCIASIRRRPVLGIRIWRLANMSELQQGVVKGFPRERLYSTRSALRISH